MMGFLIIYLRNVRKNINYLIPASKYLYDDYEKLFKNENVIVKYIPQIVGDGDEKENLENLVSQYKLNKYIKFTGFLTQDKLKNLHMC